MSDTVKRVLLVEDEVLVAMSVTLELRVAGYEVVETCSTGDESLAYLREHAVDAVLMDIGLAGAMDGVETAAAIRSFSTVPILFMSGYADREKDQAVEQVQPLGYLLKPVSFSRLRQLLDSL